MRGLATGSVILAALVATGTAQGADIPVNASRGAPHPVLMGSPVVPVTCLWCGWYVGLNAGGSWSADSATHSVPLGPLVTPANISSSSAIGGGQIGYNWQYGALVIGLETDFDARHSSGSANGLQPVPELPNDQVHLSQDQNWFGTVRGRVGWAAGNVLLYGTGGFAYGEVKSSTQEIQLPAGPSRTISDSSTRTGWAAGGGIEYAFANNLSVGIEYLHLDLGSPALFAPFEVIGDLAFPDTQTTFKATSDIVRARLNWRFNWPRI